MLWGLVGSLPMLTAMLALSGAPLAVGVKVTATVQLKFGDAVALQVPPVTAKSGAFAPLRVSLRGSENPDRLVTVTVFVLDGTFEVRVPYASVAGAPGLKVTIIEQTFCAPRFAVQVPPVIEKSAALVPLKLSISVTGCV